MKDFVLILAKTNDNIVKGKTQSIDWIKLELDNAMIDDIKDLIDIQNPQFLKSLEAKGVVTKRTFL